MTFAFFGEGRHKRTLQKLLTTEGAVFPDVRSEEEVATVSLPLGNEAHAMHIPIDELPGRWSEVPMGRPVGAFCSGDVRSSIAYAYLRCRGYDNVRILAGGYPGIIEELKRGRIWARLSKTGHSSRWKGTESGQT